jgi:hypothetical protein
MTPAEASMLVFTLFAAYPSRDERRKDTIELYERMLVDLDCAAANGAVARLIQSSKFLPTIAEVRQAVHTVQAGPRRTGVEAWGDVTKAIRYVGSYRVPTFDDPIVAHVVASLGWLELCRSTNDVADRARFVEAYDAVSAREHSEQALAPSLRLRASEGNVARLAGGTNNVTSLVAKVGRSL